MTNKYESVVTSYAGLKSSSRHISSIPSVSDKTLFAVGSSVVDKNNQIQILEYNEIKATIQCTMTLDHPNEIWWTAFHPTDEEKMVTISRQPNSNLNVARIFKIPSLVSGSNGVGGEKQKIEELNCFEVEDDSAQRAFFLPSDHSKCVISCDNKICLFDIENGSAPVTTIRENGSNQRIKSIAVDQIHENIIGGCVGSAIKLWDLRSGEVTHKIENAHMPFVLDIAFNDNKQWWMCSGGSDGFLRGWDMRVGKAECEFRASSHWVTRTIPSASHEQLILTAGTDSKVRVFNSSVFAFQNEGQLPDGEIIKSIRHDDSVYSATWASNNPWIFASVSYKGQVNICQLPSQVVDSILMGDDEFSV